jgi:DNA-binding transcriptional ArsR family regulator
MADDDDKLDEIDRKLDNIQHDVNSIQGDVRMLTTLTKETSKPELKSQIHDKFGNSDARKKIWLAATTEKQVGELADDADVAPGTVRRYASEMADVGLLSQYKDGNESYYSRSEATEGIGIEEDLMEDLNL